MYALEELSLKRSNQGFGRETAVRSPTGNPAGAEGWGCVTKDDDGMTRGGGEQLGTAEVRRVLTGQLGYALPADLVITTRAEIEAREFTAYGRGWRDCVEHAERRGQDARTGRDRQANVLAFPRQKQSSPPTPTPARYPVPPGDKPS